MKKVVLSIIALSFTFYSCKTDKTEDESNESMQTEKEEVVENKITLSQFEGSPKFEDAKISIESMDIGELDSVASVDFNFKVENYELGAQTPTAGENGLANSGKGQHIHFILNNMPYSAHYESNFSRDIPEGNHVLLAFLSRSYHESVKNAFLVQNINVGNVDDAGADLSAPHMFYSRPKGTYTGKDTEKLLLDFFLVNTEISENGNKVKATINGEEFMITEWVPYVIEGLDKGEVEIRLQLLDAEDNLIEGPFNDVTRTVTLN
jgi:hypothetical protein